MKNYGKIEADIHTLKQRKTHQMIGTEISRLKIYDSKFTVEIFKTRQLAVRHMIF